MFWGSYLTGMTSAPAKIVLLALTAVLAGPAHAQNGYSIVSIGFSQVETVRNYIASQEEHHRKISFQDEFREFLKRYEVKFDECYVWD